MAGARPVPDRYRRLQLLGEGGAGQVWLVEDSLRPGTRWALKESSGGAPSRAEALRREYVVLSRLRHPGLVESHELDRCPSTGSSRFTLEYVDGETLASAVRREGAAGCMELTAEALRVLDFIHDFGFVHRDIKPDNLLVRRRPRLGCRLVLLDLGLALTGEDGADRAGPAGTLPYMAPELFDRGAATPRSDIYSLGALIYEIVHGRPPHLPKGEDLTPFFDAVREGRRARPPLPEGYPPGLTDWIEALLSPDPSGRPASAREALARLNATTGSQFQVQTAVTRAARLASDPPAGRGPECKLLRSRLDPGNGPQLIWLHGPAGSGKSRLLRWLLGESILDGWHVRASLAGLPLLAGDEADPTGAGERLLDALRGSAASRSTLLLLDESESADGRVLRLLDRIAREGRAAPVQVVAALRSGEATRPVLRRLFGDAGTVPTMYRIDLEPLDDEAIAEMAKRATGSGDLSNARLEWLARASEGIPSVVEALLVEGAWEKGRRSPLPRARALERSTGSRLDLLSPTALTWLESLAILGADSDEADLSSLSGLDLATAREAAEEVRLAGLASGRDGRWSPLSRAVSGAVQRALRGDRRVTIHRRAAELLLGRGPERNLSWRLANLWAGARDAARVVEYAAQAARESLADGDPAEAAERFALALRHLPRDVGGRYVLRVDQARALMAAGLFGAAARAYGGALRLAPGPADRAELLGRQAHALVQAGRFARARKVAEEALGLAERHGLGLPRAQAATAIGVVLGRLGREEQAIPVLEQALELFRSECDHEMEAETLQILASCKSRLRRRDAEDDFLGAIALCRELGAHGGELKSLVGLSVIQMREGKLTEAGSLLEQVRELAGAQGNLDMQSTAIARLASLATEQGRLDRAIAMGREAVDLACHLGDRNRMMIDRCRLAEAMVGGGLPAEAAELLRDGLRQPLEAVEPDTIDYARMVLVQALLESPDAEEVDVAGLLGQCQQGFRERRKTRPLLLALALEMELLSRPGADSRFEPVRLEFEALAAEGEEAIEPEIRLRADLAAARFALRRGDAAAAEEAARRAERVAEERGLLHHRAIALVLVGQSLERSGRSDRADQSFEEAGRLLEQAAGLIEDESIRESFLSRGVFAGLRGRESTSARGEQRRLLVLYEMIHALNSETDPEVLLESILDMALRAVGAERGMILLRKPNETSFEVKLARNLELETELDAEGYSRGIVAQAGAGRSILSLKADEDERFRDLKSVSMYGIRSLMCVPLRSRGRIIGTVYLDSRREGTLFTRDDLRFIEAFANHAALALYNARERADLVVENRRLRAAAEDRVQFGNLVGRSASMQKVFDLIEKVAASDLPVLIQGESGTGKELVARAIHFQGARKRKIILSENCAAIPETLLESELFGHVRGAFTGAERDRPGLFEQADGGTLFLDEVGDMSRAMQSRLLRALQEGEIRRVGADRPIRVDVRIIAATNRNLEAEARAGRFREDLLYRLQVLMVQIAPLRERAEDIPLLIDHFLERIARERGHDPQPVDTRIRGLLQRHRWPGNVRQLESTIQRLVLLAGDAPVTIRDLESDDSLHETFLGSAANDGARFSLDDGVREQLRRALVAAGGHRERAAKLLGVSRATIYRKIREYGLK